MNARNSWRGTRFLDLYKVGLLLLLLLAGVLVESAVSGQPANDAFAQRQALSVLPSTLTADTRGATGETGEPSFGYSAPLHSVWWTWTAPSNGFLRIIEDGPLMGIDSAVYAGNALNELQLAARSESLGGLWQVSAGQAYHIVVDTLTEEEYAVQLAYFLSPPNDSFASRVMLSNPPFGRTDDLSVATSESGEPQPPSDAPLNIWFSWIATDNGRLRLFTTSANEQFSAFVGDTLETLASVPVRHSPFPIDPSSTNHLSQEYSFPVETGVRYQIALGRGPGGYPQIHENHSAVYWETVLDTVPTNGTFAGRILLAGSGGELSVNGYLVSDSRLWYEWIAPADGTLLPGIATPYFGEDPQRLTPLEAPPSGIAVTQGMSIKLSVYAPNPVNLIWKFHPLPANDAFSAAESFSGSYARLSGHNYGAGREPREPKHGAEYAGRTIWYRWTAPFSGWAAWRAWSGSGAQSTRVYEGTALTRLKAVSNRSQVVSPDGTLALHEFPAVAGKTYCFVMDSRRFRNEEKHGYSSNPPDNFEMEFSLTALQLQAQVSLLPGGSAVLAAGFSSPDPEALANVASAEYGLVYLDSFCPTLSAIANQSGGSILWSNPPPGHYLLVSLATNSSGGTAVLNPISLRIPPANDDLANAFLLEGFQLTTNSPITGASREPREPAHGDPRGIGSIWWKWTAPADGPMELGLTVYGHRIGYEPSDATGITPAMSVYRMKNGKLVRIAGTRRAKYTVGCRLRVESGQTYFIAGQIPRGYYVSDCGYPAQLSLRLGAARIASDVAGSTFTLPQPVTLAIEANFSLDEIERVEYLESQGPSNGTQVLAATDAAPFHANWENPPIGSHIISAKIYRKDGQVFTTDTAKISVR